MKHTTLEMLLFLRLNLHLWDTEMVQKLVRDTCNDADFDNVSDEELFRHNLKPDIKVHTDTL